MDTIYYVYRGRGNIYKIIPKHFKGVILSCQRDKFVGAFRASALNQAAALLRSSKLTL